MLKRAYLLVSMFLVSTAAYSGTSFVNSTIKPGEMLVVDFSFSQVPTTNIGDIDFIQFRFGGSFNDFFTGDINSFYEANLYDGNNLLGSQTVTSGQQGCCIFLESGSPGMSLETTDIDMTNIKNGTIDGRFEFVPYFDQPSLYSEVFLTWSMQTGKYVSSNSYWKGIPDPSILNFAVIPVAVTEPSISWLFFSGILVLSGFRLKRQRSIKTALSNTKWRV